MGQRLFGKSAPADIDILRAHAAGAHRRRTRGCRACALRDRGLGQPVGPADSLEAVAALFGVEEECVMVRVSEEPGLTHYEIDVQVWRTTT